MLISCSTLVAITWYLGWKREHYVKEISSSFCLTAANALSTEDMCQEIEFEIDGRLADILAGFKQQIPMIGMFLSKSKEEQLKATAKTELMKLVPNIKQRFLQKEIEAPALNKADLKLDHLSPDMDLLIDRLWKPIKSRFLVIAAAVGFFFGLLEFALILLIFA